jgi:small subunit ribosomal protein S17
MMQDETTTGDAAGQETAGAATAATGGNRRKTRIGIVVSNKMDKTAVVTVYRRVQHAKYKKFLTRRARYKIHDERNECGVGDRVMITESRPLSRDKRWRLSKIVERAKI